MQRRIDMPIEVTTVYSRKRMIKYVDYSYLHLARVWAVMAATLVLLFMTLICGITDPQGSASLGMFWLVIVAFAFGVSTVYWCFIYPRLTMGKNQALNSVKKYVFGEGSFEVETEQASMHKKVAVNYDMINKIRANGDDIYLFVGEKFRVYIVDISSLTIQQLTELKELLEKNIDAKKIKW